MTRLTFEQLLIKNLEGEITKEDLWNYMPKEKAYEGLKQISGQDFGYDVKAWKEWLKSNKKNLDWSKFDWHDLRR